MEKLGPRTWGNQTPGCKDEILKHALAHEKKRGQDQPKEGRAAGLSIKSKTHLKPSKTKAAAGNGDPFKITGREGGGVIGRGGVREDGP